jgi:hypothetical protein
VFKWCHSGSSSSAECERSIDTSPRKSLAPNRSKSQTVTSKILDVSSALRIGEYTKLWFQQGLFVLVIVLVRRLDFSLLSGKRNILA